MSETYQSNKHRNWFLWGWLGTIILSNLFTIISFLTGGDNPLAYIVSPDENRLYIPTVIGIANIASAAAIVSCVLIILGYRIGYYGLVISYIVMMIASLMIGLNISMVLMTGLVILLTWVLLRPLWASMR